MPMRPIWSSPKKLVRPTAPSQTRIQTMTQPLRKRSPNSLAAIKDRCRMKETEGAAGSALEVSRSAATGTDEIGKDIDFMRSPLFGSRRVLSGQCNGKSPRARRRGQNRDGVRRAVYEPPGDRRAKWQRDSATVQRRTSYGLK